MEPRSINSQCPITSHCYSPPRWSIIRPGGWYFNTRIKTAEIYDPVSNTWTAIRNMNVGRSGHAAVYLSAPVNKILVMGGVGEGLNIVLDSRTCELYDFRTKMWTLNTLMIDGRVYHSAFYLPSLGKIVVIGGDAASQRAEMYTLSTAKRTRSVNTMPGMNWPTTALLSNGQVLIAYGNAKTARYLFDPRINSFKSEVRISQGRDGILSIVLPSGLVVFTGGFVEAILVQYHQQPMCMTIELIHGVLWRI
jgi:hypothetical protein